MTLEEGGQWFGRQEGGDGRRGRRGGVDDIDRKETRLD